MDVGDVVYPHKDNVEITGLTLNSTWQIASLGVFGLNILLHADPKMVIVRVDNTSGANRTVYIADAFTGLIRQDMPTGTTVTFGVNLDAFKQFAYYVTGIGVQFYLESEWGGDDYVPYTGTYASRLIPNTAGLWVTHDITADVGADSGNVGMIIYNGTGDISSGRIGTRKVGDGANDRWVMDDFAQKVDFEIVDENNQFQTLTERFQEGKAVIADHTFIYKLGYVKNRTDMFVESPSVYEDTFGDYTAGAWDLLSYPRKEPFDVIAVIVNYVYSQAVGSQEVNQREDGSTDPTLTIDPFNWVTRVIRLTSAEEFEYYRQTGTNATRFYIRAVFFRKSGGKNKLRDFTKFNQWRY